MDRIREEVEKEQQQRLDAATSDLNGEISEEQAAAAAAATGEMGEQVPFLFVCWYHMLMSHDGWLFSPAHDGWWYMNNSLTSVSPLVTVRCTYSRLMVWIFHLMCVVCELYSPGGLVGIRVAFWQRGHGFASRREWVSLSLSYQVDNRE